MAGKRRAGVLKLISMIQSKQEYERKPI